MSEYCEHSGVRLDEPKETLPKTSDEGFVMKKSKCPACDNGKREWWDAEYENCRMIDCPICDGTGEITVKEPRESPTDRLRDEDSGRELAKSWTKFREEVLRYFEDDKPPQFTIADMNIAYIGGWGDRTKALTLISEGETAKSAFLERYSINLSEIEHVCYKDKRIAELEAQLAKTKELK